MFALRRAVAPARPSWCIASASFSNATTFKASDLQITRTTTPKQKLPDEQLVFGKSFTDHMLEIEWNFEGGWSNPRIVPYHKLELEPSCSVFHYAIECFEGMKAYLDERGRMLMFRPDMNMARLNSSASRICLPTFDGQELMSCIRELIAVDRHFIPQKPGYSLYVRPTMIATDPSLGVAPSKKALLYVIMSPSGPYYRTGFAPVRLYASKEYTRAWPGGTGGYKLGSNYAPGILPQVQAAKNGYQQVMWLFGPDHLISEVGTMNVFFFIKNDHGERELVTAPLDGTILPGVTRDSILQLAREWNEFKVSERYLSMKDVIRMHHEKRIIEVFGAGTAAIVSPVKGIYFDGTEYDIPLNPDNPAQQSGALTARLADTLMGIQYGRIPHPWSVVL